MIFVYGKKDVKPGIGGSGIFLQKKREIFVYSKKDVKPGRGEGYFSTKKREVVISTVKRRRNMVWGG